MPFKRLLRILRYKLDELVIGADRADPEPGTFRTPEEAGFSKSPFTRKELEYYANLELKPTKDFIKIRSQYKVMMKKYHPDRYGGDPVKTEIAMKVTVKLNEAYDYFQSKYE